MNNQENNNSDKTKEYEARIHYLEQINRQTLDALDQAAHLGDFQTSINQMESVSLILEETRRRICTLIPFEATAFFLVNEENSEFYLAQWQPEHCQRFINVEVENYIENGTFAWAIREQRPIFISTMDHTKKILLQVLTTASRVRGMFVGVLTYGEMDVPLVSLSLVTIILRHSANALESFELYNLIKTINQNLEKTIEERTIELRRSQEQLRHAQKMEALGRLASGVAHDFNNVLTAISIASEVSLQHPNVPPEVGKSFKEILGTAERASDLIRHLLAFSKKQVITPRILDIETAASDIKKMLSRLIAEDIDIFLDSCKDLPPIKADPGQIDQILMNLAVNSQDAIREHPDPTIKKQIAIKICHTRLDDQSLEVKQKIVKNKGDYIRIDFSDTGVGMDGDTCQKIFEPFFTTKEEGQGTGLGLSIVYGIIQQNSGGITVQSIPGEGTTFTFYWPCQKTFLDEDQNPAPTDNTTNGSETILVVEDDASIRETLEDLLITRGYKVISAKNGENAMEKARKFPGTIHLLLTDLTMPKMGGIELAESLKTIMPFIKIIFTTGYMDTLPDILNHLPPNTRFIWKPYSGDIARTIRNLLDEK